MTLLSMVYIFAGLDTDIKAVLRANTFFTAAGYDYYFVEIMLILFGITVVVILFNLLIAIMGTTVAIVCK